LYNGMISCADNFAIEVHAKSKNKNGFILNNCEKMKGILCKALLIQPANLLHVVYQANIKPGTI